MSRTKESLNASQERSSESRLDGFRKDMNKTGRGELADNLIAGLDNPEKATLILRPAGSNVIDGVEKLAESALDNPDSQFVRIDCYLAMSESDFIGYTNHLTGEHVPGRIDGEAKICLLEGADQLPRSLMTKLVCEVIPRHEAAFYLTASQVEPTSDSHGIGEPVMSRMGRIYQMPPRDRFAEAA